MDGVATHKVHIGSTQRMAANHLYNSQKGMAVVTLFGEIDVSALVATRERMAIKGQSRPTFSHFIIKAVALALQSHPKLNAHFSGSELECSPSIDIGLAVARENGDLVVPVLRAAETKTVMQIAQEVIALVDRARSNNLQLADVRGATFTLSNVGGGGITRWSTPIVSAPQVAILAVSAIRDGPLVRDGTLQIRKLLPVSLSFDHRVINGNPASQFLETLGSVLSDPQVLSIPHEGEQED